MNVKDFASKDVVYDYTRFIPKYPFLPGDRYMCDVCGNILTGDVPCPCSGRISDEISLSREEAKKLWEQTVNKIISEYLFYCILYVDLNWEKLQHFKKFVLLNEIPDEQLLAEVQRRLKVANVQK